MNATALLRTLAVCLGCLLGAPCASAAADAAVAEVGKVSLLIGSAKLEGADGVAREIAVQGSVRVGDRIETAAGAHVHVRFVDGGVVSVRPASQLWIEAYQRADSGQGGAIKFRLEQGTVRSITGEWGEAARERFRLNTPIAAIGVRGTDFVVQADADNARVAVLSGAIIAAPLGGACRPDGLGPCLGDSAKLLAADMGNVMLELHRTQSVPHIVPLNQMLAEPLVAARTPVDEGVVARKLETRDAFRETAALQALAQNSVSTTPPPVAPPPVVEPPPVVVPPPVVEPPPAVIPTLPAPASTTLIWGRWAETPFPGDATTVSRFEASLGGRERVAENEYYVLYRQPSSLAFPGADAGTVSFNLAGGLANLVTGYGPVQAAQIQGGQLSLDFAARRFDTSLSLSSVPTGAVSLQAAGSIAGNGLFTAIGLDTRIYGAYTGGAREAAYIFEKTTAQGMLTGVTNWGRR